MPGSRDVSAARVSPVRSLASSAPGVRQAARLARRARTRVQARLFDSSRLAAIGRRKHVLCLGDSHVSVMDRVDVPGLRFRAEPLRGATASGVLNPASNTKSYATFSARLERAKPWQEVLLHLGEVDCGFVIWYRARKHDLDVEAQLALTLDSYEGFIGEVVSRGFSRVYVLSAALPTITDYPDQWGEIGHLRSEITVSQADRTALTARFNSELAHRCERAGAAFIDATTDQLDTATGLIKREFVRPDGDHHLALVPYARVVSSALRRRLEMADPSGDRFEPTLIGSS